MNIPWLSTLAENRALGPVLLFCGDFQNRLVLESRK